MLGGARQSLVRSLMSCPGNLRWRVLLVGARMELGVGAVEKARFLLQRALQEVPGKSKSYVYLECSRVEEYLGNLDTARSLLLHARQEVSREWKVFLEAVLVEARAGYVEKAAKVAREAVRQHSGTGRLWAMYIQLCHRLEIKYFNDTEKIMIDCKLGNPIETEEARKTLEDIQKK
jgi:la-related protein 1